jgi:hypothetical protein
MLKIECSIIIFLLAGIISCTNKEISLAERYTGYWAETQFYYYFYPNNEFVFKTSGHFGNTTPSFVPHEEVTYFAKVA